MRNWSSQLVFLLLTAAPCLGQSARVNINADSALPRDTRPFGKYLVEICALSGEQRTLKCAEAPLPPNLTIPARGTPAIVQNKDQTITLRLVCNPATKTACAPTNPKVGDDFFVAATADSGQPVQQKVLLGIATPVGGFRTVQYRANGPGPLIIRATAQANGLYAAAAPVDLILQINGDSASAPAACPVLPPSPSTQSTPLDAPTIVSLLGNPTPFILAAQGANTIVIYSTREPLRAVERRILARFKKLLPTSPGAPPVLSVSHPRRQSPSQSN